MEETLYKVARRRKNDGLLPTRHTASIRIPHGKPRGVGRTGTRTKRPKLHHRAVGFTSSLSVEANQQGQIQHDATGTSQIHALVYHCSSRGLFENAHRAPTRGHGGWRPRCGGPGVAISRGYQRKNEDCGRQREWWKQ